MRSYLASRFDVIWAIDTSTDQTNGDMVSISCALECCARMTAITQAQINLLAFRNCPNGEPERYAWSRLVALVASRPKYGEYPRIAVISDHDRAKHSKYNARELPIYGDFYLPHNFTLIYATSEAGKENVLNRLIIECDKRAKKFLRQLKQKGYLIVGNSILPIHKIRDLNSD